MICNVGTFFLIDPRYFSSTQGPYFMTLAMVIFHSYVFEENEMDYLHERYFKMEDALAALRDQLQCNFIVDSITGKHLDKACRKQIGIPWIICSNDWFYQNPRVAFQLAKKWGVFECWQSLNL